MLSLALFVLFLAIGVHSFVLKPSLGRLSFQRNLFGSPSTPEPKKDTGGGIFGNKGNPMDSIKKLQDITKQYEVIMKELGETPVTGSDPTGQVQATFTASQLPIGIRISESILSQGAEAVSQASTQAMIDAHSKANALAKSKMVDYYSSLNLPPGFLK